jgi:hypothetical protein
MYIHTRTHTRARAHTHTNTHTQTNTHARAHTHTHTCTHTHTHHTISSKSARHSVSSALPRDLLQASSHSSGERLSSCVVSASAKKASGSAAICRGSLILKSPVSCSLLVGSVSNTPCCNRDRERAREKERGVGSEKKRDNASK